MSFVVAIDGPSGTGKGTIAKLVSKKLNLVNSNSLTLTSSGLKIAKYLYKRHLILTDFLTKLNKNNFSLDQVEKIEHFIDPLTLKNIQKLLTHNII